MAIDLFCYSSNSKEELGLVIKGLSAQVEEFYSNKFIVSLAREASQIHHEIAMEHGLNARSLFLIRVNEKNAVEELPELVSMVKNIVGGNKVIVLLENEKLL
ncbi:hypothetical protein RBA41_26070 [Massilia sp. CCM 9210]|uniref:hypothetical protein n=1 Tax=Massilia scottii TaxID=3057166 RepID=UPI002796B547|nr:hypothetical protein [Massilia sp. CCM 9210]MDQ1816774.1 hypothetical protein [Massilia sp. CCM 9210]